ncbi:hypothetical protein D9757_003278 [Collybiopsis confluens]|uniref:DUF6533 domain-containing protein n=1 Tax=Collybiopsis confluens TaxID=2823264 RepID=A0A8H5HZ24_9AGAR|nr:hypothetical protein D9757_003278 [Collybiopsis confluens]
MIIAILTLIIISPLAKRVEFLPQRPYLHPTVQETGDMGSTNLTDSQLKALSECIANGRMGQGITYASSAIYIYDYTLTVWDEVKYIWRPRRITVGSVAFFLARYLAMAATVVVLLPGSDSAFETSNTANVLRLISIVASEFIIAVRTWAIWSRSRKILLTLVAFSLATLIPAAIIVAESVITTHVEALVSEEFIDICSLTTSNINRSFVVPYILTILYESVTLSLSLIRILNWRKNIPKSIRTPLLDNLWRDGVLYFSFMLVLGFMNVGIVLQQGHLAKSKQFGDITATGSSVYQSRTQIQFTSNFSEATSSSSDRRPRRFTRNVSNEEI